MLRPLVVSLVCSVIVALLPWVARADDLRSYIASLGAPNNITVVERTPQGPSKISFQSQIWREMPWRHEIHLRSPLHVRRRDIVVLMLTGGDGGAQRVDSAARLADALGVRTAILTRVPNQPLFDGKTEDVLLSYSLDQFRRTGDPSWPLLFPMVGSVVKGIDVLRESLGEANLRVVLMGASKRGWTTYLAGAIDDRVAAIIPAVFEMISMPEQIALARERYGRDSEKIGPYTQLGLTDSLQEPRIRQLMQWVDPIEYFPRLTKPKLILLGANDPYWVVDSVREYWDKLPQPKALRILPNVGHGALDDPRGMEAVVSFIRVLLGDKPMPQVRWEFTPQDEGVTVVRGQGSETITRCELWQAASQDGDFRDDRFVPAPCAVLDGGKRFEATVKRAGAASTAFFADLETTTREPEISMRMSTETRVLEPAKTSK